MIILKILVFTFLTWLFARGIMTRDLKVIQDLESKLSDYESYAKEKFQLLEAEKTILITTIDELREELKQVKGLR